MNPVVEFCDEVIPVGDDGLTIGRDADLEIDDNRFLHRRFLTISLHQGIWAIANVGDQLTATISDGSGRLEAFLAPGGVLPLVVEKTIVRFTAGPTSYEFVVKLDEPAFTTAPSHQVSSGETTVGEVSLTPDQRRLVLALAEPALRGVGRVGSSLPSSGEAATRLGWTTTKFNRKLDNVCQKLAAVGVRGLHGEPGRLASNRRARLVEYALAVRLVTVHDLALLDHDSGDGDGADAGATGIDRGAC